jgi:hypothetical protein
MFVNPFGGRVVMTVGSAHWLKRRAGWDCETCRAAGYCRLTRPVFAVALLTVLSWR